MMPKKLEFWGMGQNLGTKDSDRNKFRSYVVFQTINFASRCTKIRIISGTSPSSKVYVSQLVDMSFNKELRLT